VGTFRSLPSAEWMALSDWRTATGGTFAADIGVGGEELINGRSAVDAAGRGYSGFPRPVRVGTRMVVVDRYGPELGPTQYLHYAAAKNEQFVSNYARSHPADDLAESYAHFVLHPAQTREKLDVEPHNANKWSYLVRRLQQNAAAAAPPVRPKLREGNAADAYEREADLAAEAVVTAGRVDAPLAPAPVSVQRLAKEGAPSAPADVPPQLEHGRTHALVVEDDAARLEPGQMRKTQFLDGLQRQAC